MLTLSQSLQSLQSLQRRISPRPISKMSPNQIEEMKKTLKIELNHEEIDSEHTEHKQYHPPPIRRKNCMYFSFKK